MGSALRERLAPTELHHLPGHDPHEAANRLGVSKMTVVRLIRDGLLPARQVCARAPYVIREEDLARLVIRPAIARGRPISADPRQESLSFQ